MDEFDVIEKVSARGERAAIGGYLPQFDAFAMFAYNELVNGKLEWIKIADPEAEKLDDIQYSTFTEIHAYQVKWTIADNNISYNNFKKLFPQIASSWKGIQKLPTSTNRKVIPHLLTNKLLSRDDSIKDGENIIGSFTDFFHDVWLKIKIGDDFDPKWKSIIKDLKKLSKLNKSEFNEFIKIFEFQPEFKPATFSVRNMSHSKADEDLIKFRNFILENDADPKRQVLFLPNSIIEGLNWKDRFKTTFNHDLIVDKQKYQPIQTTIDLLNSKLEEFNNGYIFLLGGPGTGKSTLLSQWSKKRKERIIQYYAFDFTMPSSQNNYFERGNTLTLFFDLVVQLKESGIYKTTILPYKDLNFLKEVFFAQLKELSEIFESTGQKTILIVDGLDHVPREYKSAKQSFISELPLPSELPNGVYIILGSQSYDLEDLRQEIKTEFKDGQRTIQIESLNKNEVYKYIDSNNFIPQLSSDQKSLVFEKSQGHPLYLSYLIGKINESQDIDKTLEGFIHIDGDIGNYYNKIWVPIKDDQELVKFIGLICRINGSINLDFLSEWNYNDSILIEFKNGAMLLFNKSGKVLTFFHNSFRQFLLEKTATKILTEEFDKQKDIEYNFQLADFYKSSTVEPTWKRNQHLLKSEQYDKFIDEATPDSFTSQFLNYRPVEEITQEAKLGIEIAEKWMDLNVLTRYLFVLAEYESRINNFNPASLTENLLAIGKLSTAKNYLRNGSTLHCSESYALKAAHLFNVKGDKVEGNFLFNLAYPNVISDTEIIIEDSHRYDELIDTLEEWVNIAPHFMPLENILNKINNIKFIREPDRSHFREEESDLRLRLLNKLCYGLIELKKWTEIKKIFSEYDPNKKEDMNSFFLVIQSAIETCLDIGNNYNAKEFLYALLEYFTIDSTNPIGKIFIADLIYKVVGDQDLVFEWIKDLPQPYDVENNHFFSVNSLDPFIPLIKLNKLLNLCGKGVSITTSVPSANPGTDEEKLVEFERMLCLIAQILSDGILGGNSFNNITTTVYPIVRFYYYDISHHNKYSYMISQCKREYFDFLINAIKKVNHESLEVLGDYLCQEFADNSKYWTSKIQRELIKSLFLNKYDAKKSKEQLIRLESFMLKDKDIDGRITECISHSKLLILMDDKDSAEKWMKKAIQESIGVGYRKDYQFSTWIEKLKNINCKEPEKAPDRIKWFLSHLKHIKETTEGRTYWDASDKILETTFAWNFAAGLTQLQWQVDNGLISFEYSMFTFIDSYIDRAMNEDEINSIIQLYSEILLCFSETSSINILEKILKKGYSLFGTKFLEGNLSKLIDAILIKSLEENRHSLLSTIEKFCIVNSISINDYYFNFQIPVNNDQDTTSSSSNSLRLKNDHIELTEDEVLKRVSNFESINSLLQETDHNNSYFDWSKVIEQITPSLTIADLKILSTLEIGNRRESSFYAKLSESSLSLGDKELAWDLANKSLELSSESGWDRHYDGGSRIIAFDALRKINEKESFEKAFKLFCFDVANNNYFYSYIRRLEDILPLLSKDYDEVKIWSEIYSYLERLLANSTPVKELPDIISIDKPISDTLIDYLIYLSKNPVKIICERARKLLAHKINEGDEYALNLLLSSNTDICLELEILNDLMMYLRELNSSKLNEFKKIALKLAISKDYSIRKNSILILNHLGEPIPIAESISLPPVYSLHLSPYKSIEYEKEFDPYFPKIDINNPEELIKPFNGFINILSEETGIERTNLLYRVDSIMKEIGNPDEWTVEYEKELRNHLEDLELKYAYFRPRVITAKRAIMFSISELIDSETINDYRIRILYLSHDYAIPFINEIPKPSFVQTVKEKEYGFPASDWINKIEDSVRLNEGLVDYRDNKKIIGEYSFIKSLNWEYATEIYKVQLSTEMKLKKKEEDFFDFAFELMTEDYYEYFDAGRCIIIYRDHRFDQFTMKSKWLAFNPLLAKHLSWEPERSNLFGWKDSEGNLMVESIYWANGNIDMKPPHLYSESGEGWFVIASDEAIKQIKELEPKLYIQKSLSRSKVDKELIEKKVFKVIDYNEIIQT